MRIPERLTVWIYWACIKRIGIADPDKIITMDDEPEKYMKRWWFYKIRKSYTKLQSHSKASKWFQIFFNIISRDDHDRALHCHPWWNISIVLKGTYREIFADREVIRPPGSIIFRSANCAHRLEVVEGPVSSLFITGRYTRMWGFRTESGFKPWEKYNG